MDRRSPGAGNVQADPLFLAAPSDLRLGPSSPAVDAGNNTLVPGGTTVDVRGLPRFFDDPEVPDTGVGNVPPGVVDMGAYERIPITVTRPDRPDDLRRRPGDLQRDRDRPADADLPVEEELRAALQRRKHLGRDDRHADHQPRRSRATPATTTSW